MGATGKGSTQISAKISAVLRRRIEEERSLQGMTLAELVSEALELYLGYKEE